MRTLDLFRTQQLVCQRWLRNLIRACKPRSFRALCLISILLTIWIATPVLALELDYGDAPTDLTSIDGNLVNTYGSASHQIDGATYLGLRVDAEANNQPSTYADGDDLVGTPNDEDGVTFPMVGTTRVLSVGTSNNLTIRASVSGFLNAWIDWNQNGNWNDPGEQIAANSSLTTGNNNLSVTVPDAAPHGATYARFRFSAASGLVSTGATTNNGEVEDYQVNIALPSITSCSVGLLNGGFELPDIPMTGGNPQPWQDFGGNRIVSYQENDVPWWGTIPNSPGNLHLPDVAFADGFGDRNAIELWKGTESYYPLIKPFEGNQFAEINANVPGRLYEDFALPAGAQVRWQVAHHGRDGSDMMEVLMGAPDREISQSTNTTPNTEWRVYSGIYTVPSGQDITRFSLKAIGGGGAGNFVDDVRLTAKCPPVVNGYKSVKLTTDVNSNSKINPGDTLTYSLYYTNTGLGPAAGFQINERLPVGVTLAAPGISVTTLQNGVAVTNAATKNPDYTGAAAGVVSNLLNPGALLDSGKVIRIDIPVTVDASTVGSLLNQGTAIANDFSGLVLTDNIDSTTTGIGIAVPAGSVAQIAKVSIDPTSIQVIGSSTKANVLLLKRITAIHDNSNLNPNDNTPLNTVVNDSTAANNSYWPSSYVIGATNAGKIKPGDSIEYTIYFLNVGASNIKSLQICDLLTVPQSFQNGSYGGVGKDLQIKIGDNPIQDLTAADDPPIDRARVYLPGATNLPSNCNLAANSTASSTTNSYVVSIGVTGAAGTGIPALTLIPGATAANTPNSYGWVRFKSIVP
jgi:uncharacterized repeat protein (TIGR01451 family)